MDDISTSILLEKNELIYLISCLADGNQNANATALSEYTGIIEPDTRKAIAGLMRKKIICYADNKLITAKLFDFYIKKLLSADSMETIDGEKKKLIFNNPGFILQVKEHELSKTHVSIQAFRTREELLEAV